MNKKSMIMMLLAFVTMTGQAQDVNTCQPIAERILTAAQNHTSDGIDELLAPDFHYSNFKQPIAGAVLKQIIAQMPAMTGWATILFNAENLVLEANLLPGALIRTATTPTANVQSEVSVVRIPMHRYGGLPIVTVIIDGQPCNMFFDSGAPSVILNSKYFDHNINGQVMGSGGHGAVGTGTVSGMHHIKLMDMGGISLSETDIMTSDLSNLEVVGVTVHGILGQSFYKDFDVLFDFKRGEIVLLNPDITYQWLINEGYRSQTVKGVDKGHLLAFECKVGGTSAMLAFDSGAQTNLLSTDWLEQHSSSVKGIKKDSLIGYGEGQAAITKGKTTLTLGGRTFKKQQTVFSDISFLQESKNIDGLFGCEVLVKQKLLLSYKRQELLLID